jgi:hypothetical protein
MRGGTPPARSKVLNTELNALCRLLDCGVHFSDRNAWMTSTREARAAGTSDARMLKCNKETTPLRRLSQAQ